MILLMDHNHDRSFLYKFMTENGFIRFEKLESPDENWKRYRLYRNEESVQMMSTVSVDGQWQRIDGDLNSGEPMFARHVRTPGGMVIGRIVRGAALTRDGVLTAQRWRYGRFTNIGEFTEFDKAVKAIEALP